MTLKLKTGYWYECDREDWRKLKVMAGVHPDGAVPVVEVTMARDGKFHITLRDYDDEASETDRALLQTYQRWDLHSHEALLRRGWGTVWDEVHDIRYDARLMTTATQRPERTVSEGIPTITRIAEARQGIIDMYPELSLRNDHDAAQAQVHELARLRILAAAASVPDGSTFGNSQVEDILYELAANLNFVNIGKYRVSFPAYFLFIRDSKFDVRIHLALMRL